MARTPVALLHLLSTLLLLAVVEPLAVKVAVEVQVAY
jgi:hypothetical protein